MDEVTRLIEGGKQARKCSTWLTGLPQGTAQPYRRVANTPQVICKIVELQGAVPPSEVRLKVWRIVRCLKP